MRRIAKLPVWYSIVSEGMALLLILFVAVNAMPLSTGATFKNILFLLLVICYFNCLPLAIVSIFLFYRKDLRKYSLFNLIAIIVVVYFGVKMFGY